MVHIPFSPPDIGEDEIAEVVDTLRSGWITTGPKTKKFEQELTAFCGDGSYGMFEFRDGGSGIDSSYAGDWSR